MTQHKINATLKAGAGYDAPWVTIGGDSEAEAALNLRAVVPGSQATDFFALVAEAAAALKGFYTATDQLGGQTVPQPPQASNAFSPQQQQAVQQYQQSAAQPQQAAPPVQQQQAPAGGPVCKHGAMTYRTGTGKNNKAWAAHFCPTPKGAPDQCEPVWQRD